MVSIINSTGLIILKELVYPEGKIQLHVLNVAECRPQASAIDDFSSPPEFSY